MASNKSAKDGNLQALKEENRLLLQEIKDLKNKLARQESSFETLFQNLPLPSYLVKFDKGDFFLERANTAALAMANGQISNFYDQPVRELFCRHPDAIEACLQCHHAVQPVTYSLSYNIISTGEFRNVEFTLLPLPPNHVIATLLDITERQKAREALSQTQDRLRILTENLPGVVYLCQYDRNLTLLYVNDKVEELTGYSKDLFLKGEIRFLDIYVKEDIPDLHAKIKQAVDTCQVFTIRYRIRHKDGHMLWVEEKGAPIFNKSGKLLLLEGVIMNITQRQAMEDALHETKLRYELATKAAMVGVWDMNLQTNTFFLDPIFKSLLGYADHEIPSGVKFWLRHMIHPKDRKSLIRAYRDHLERKTEEFVCEHRMLHRDGGVRWFLARGKAICGNDNKLIRVTGTNTEITQQRLAQRALQLSEERYKRLFEASPIPLWEEDLSEIIPYFDEIKDQGVSDFRAYFKEHPEVVGRCASMVRVRDVNPAALDLFKAKDKMDFLNNYYRIFPTQSLDRLGNEMASVAEGGTSFCGEHLNRTLKGDDINLTVHLNIDRDYQGGHHRAIVSVQDITARKRAEEALRRSEERLKLLVENLPVMILAHDEQGNYIFWNRQCERVTGFIADQIINNPKAKDYLFPNQKYRKQVEREASELGLGYSDWENLLATADGSKRVVSWTSISDQCPIPGWASWETGVDVTRRKEAEQDMTRAKEEAEAASASKSMFLANMSHEIRTPITTMLGMAELLTRSQLTADQQRYVSLISQAGENLLRLINDLLDFSKVEAGLVELNPKKFSVRDLSAQVVSMLDHQARKKDLSLRLQLDENLPAKAFGDPDRLRQVLLNLVNNALKFTERGEVSILVKQVSRNNPGLILFTVRDTGPGIPADQHNRIFESFTQADSTIQHHYGGQGLGLPIARRLVGLMGGVMCLESEPGKGSTFSFTVRLTVLVDQAKEEFADSIQTARQEKPSQAPLAILLVDDLDVNRDLIKLLLQDTNFEFLEACNGREAFEKYIDEGGIDLILMDLMMPEMGGLEATRAIRQFEKEHGLPPIPILALSAQPFVEDMRNSLEAGCNAHLSRPFSSKKLLQAILELKPETDHRQTRNTMPSCSTDPRLEPLIPKVYARLETLVEQGRECLQEANFNQLRRIGHSVKGLGASYGLNHIAGLGRQLEEQALAINAGDASEILARIEYFVEEWSAERSEINPEGLAPGNMQ